MSNFLQGKQNHSHKKQNYVQKSNRYRPVRPEVVLSKALSRTLRHDAVKMNLKISKAGEVLVEDLLSHPNFKDYKLEDILSVVSSNDKQRFQTRTDENGQLLIRAVQGHTIRDISDEELLTEITESNMPAACIHGTYQTCLAEIMKSGLSRMKRNHIHFAEAMPEDDNTVVSGMRSNCSICIYIDMIKAIKDGIRFFRAKNNVILSRGLNDSGIIPSEYFQKVEHR